MLIDIVHYVKVIDNIFKSTGKFRFVRCVKIVKMIYC